MLSLNDSYFSCRKKKKIRFPALYLRSTMESLTPVDYKWPSEERGGGLEGKGRGKGWDEMR